MAIIYVDYENGNDSNDGTTFANRKKTITSASSSASAGDVIRLAKSPDPTSLGNGTIPDPHPSINSYRSISTITYSNVTGATDITVTSHNCTTGDIVEIYNNTNSYYINGVYEVTVVDSSSLTLNGYNAGANASGSGGKFRVISGKCIKLASAPVKNVASFAGGSARTAWTASTNVTTSLYSNYSDYASTKPTMQGGYSDQIVIGSNFTTGKAAYYTLPSTLDLSGYQQLSFHIHQYSGTKVLAGNYSLKLCSDTTGDTAVNTFTIPQPGGTSGSTSDPWSPITVDLGTNLGSSIQSIALYVDSDSGAQSMRICNIIACKAKSSADSLTLRSLVSRNSTTVDDQKLWYSIEAIEGDGDIVVVGPMGRVNYSKTSLYAALHSAWFGDTGGTYTFYKRECFDTSVDNNATSTSTQVQSIGSGGSSSAKITISGGWDTSDSMSTRNGLTFYDGICAADGYGLYSGSLDYLTVENIGCVRYYRNFYFQSSDYLSIKNCFSVFSANYGAYFRGCDYFEDLELYATSGQGYIVYLYACDNPKPRADGPYIRKLYWCSTYYGHYFASSGEGGTWEFDIIWCAVWAAAADIQFQNGPMIIDQVKIPIGNTSSNSVFSFKNNQSFPESVGIGSFDASGLYYGFTSEEDQSVKIDYLNFTAVTKYGYSIGLYAGRIDSFGKAKIYGGTIDKRFDLAGGGVIYTKNLTRNTSSTDYVETNASHAYHADYDGVSGVYRNETSHGRLESDTSTRRTASGYSWKATITSANASKSNGYIWNIAKVAVEANSQVTASVYVYRTGTGINAGLKVSGGQLAGFASTEAYCTGSAGAWEQVTVTGTPTENGVITIQAEAYTGGTLSHYAYFDDFSITQA